MLSAEQIIKHYKMEPLLPEGGYFAVMTRSPLTIGRACLPESYNSERGFYNAIMFLITSESFSKLHHLPGDEVYHFYLGDPVEQVQLLANGEVRVLRLGQDILNGELLQSVAPADCWHGSRLVPGGKFALLGTVMSPAYDERDYTHGDAQDLIARYPSFADMIRNYT